MSPNVAPSPGKSAHPVAEWLHGIPSIMEMEWLVLLGIDIHFRYSFTCPAKTTSASFVYVIHAQTPDRWFTLQQNNFDNVFMPIIFTCQNISHHPEAASRREHPVKSVPSYTIYLKPVTNKYFSEGKPVIHLFPPYQWYGKKRLTLTILPCKHTNGIY